MLPISALPANERVAVSAHKGGREAARSATWEAYEAAATSGAEYIEFDIRRTSDSVFVVFHDDRVRPEGPPITQTTYEDLCAGAGYPVPRVRDVMKLIAGRVAPPRRLRASSFTRAGFLPGPGRLVP